MNAEHAKLLSESMSMEFIFDKIKTACVEGEKDCFIDSIRIDQIKELKTLGYKVVKHNYVDFYFKDERSYYQILFE